MPFQPGQSGNPGGAPRKGESLREILRASMTPTKKKRVANKLYKMAMEGDPRAMALLYDNHDGKAPQSLELSSPEGTAVRLRWEPDADS